MKLASKEELLSVWNILFYVMALAILILYALGWQYILKKFSLVTAYMNRSVTIVWGTAWGVFLFEEYLTVNKIVGLILIILGIWLCIYGKESSEHNG